MQLLSYNTNGLRNMPIELAIKEVAKAGYDGIELSLHKNHLHPFTITQAQLDSIQYCIVESKIKVVDLATGCDNLLSDERFEPSLITPSEKGRRTRLELIKSSIEIAQYLEIPVVNFASGYKKDGLSVKTARNYLIEGIHECLGDAGNVVLAIEPEPDMFVQTTTEAISIIEEINSEKFKLNLDVGHVYCCEDDYLKKIEKSLPYTCHIHVEDIKNRIHHHEIPGTGEIDFKTIIELCIRNHYSKFLSVELYHHVDVWEQALKESRDYMLKIMQTINDEIKSHPKK